MIGKRGLIFAASVIGAACLTHEALAEPTDAVSDASTAGLPSAKRPTAEECAVRTADNASACSSLFGVMLQYQKMMNKEAREEARLQREDRQRVIDAAAAKIKSDTASISAGMEESRDKAASLQPQPGEAPAIKSLSSVTGAKPPAAAGTLADVCRERDQCAEPCKQPPC